MQAPTKIPGDLLNVFLVLGEQCLAANEIHELEQRALLDVGERGQCNSMSSQETPVVLQK